MQKVVENGYWRTEGERVYGVRLHSSSPVVVECDDGDER